MKKFIFRLVFLFIGILVAAYVVPGIRAAGYGEIAKTTLLLGLLNVFIKPLVLILTIPVNVLTLGLFTFFINGFLLWLAARIVSGFDVTGFFTAVLGALVISIISISSKNLIR